ncbi:hypothetical protein RAC83_002365 [Xylella fastidiosa]|nr:hypothetical protein [Xylella fastidiosa]
MPAPISSVAVVFAICFSIDLFLLVLLGHCIRIFDAVSIIGSSANPAKCAACSNDGYLVASSQASTVTCETPSRFANALMLVSPDFFSASSVSVFTSIFFLLGGNNC